VRLQLARLQPAQDWAVKGAAAFKRDQAGTATPEDAAMIRDVSSVLEERFQAREGPSLYSIQNKVDAIFLLLAIRSILTMGDRIVLQLTPLGKEAEAAAVRDAFTSQYSIIKELRDVTIHYDEYALGQGRRQDLIVDPEEGLAAAEDEDGFISIAWAGHRLRLL